MKKNFYITTTLPYVNADPHMGHALEFVHADIIARWKRLTGHEVFFNTGTDEHGLKIYRKAQEEKKNTHEYVDFYAKRFRTLLGELNISEHNFIRTTDSHHKNAAQEFWKRCEEAGDIYKKEYKTKYCVGCELEKTDSDLVGGKCPEHPNLSIEIREEENYFFRFSKYQNNLLHLYEENPSFVIPTVRLNEVKAFVSRGLSDFSISRLKEKMPWGISVPGDDKHVMYVWFDALVNYASAIGWPNNTEMFEKWWPVTQFAGKDNLRQQAAMWQAILMSAGLPSSKQIIIHGFLTSDGQKMSKSLGNVINPLEIIEKYGTDALRYFLAREVNTFEDSDITLERFKESYNANLANGLGNLVSRIMKIAEDTLNEPVAVRAIGYKFTDYFKEKMDEFRIDLAMDYIWNKIGELDREIQEKKPWESKDKKVIKTLVTHLYHIGSLVEPFMPDTAERIKNSVEANQTPGPLFKRIEV
jgi:methionyl-tRNA synthetase